MVTFDERAAQAAAVTMSTKDPSPLLGYNNNVRHKRKVFHIQTEDSGFKYGHVITHLFMDGGRVLKSVKTSYAEYMGDARVVDIVREMMKQQHKAMFIALRDGKFDALVEAGSVPPPSRSTAASQAPPPAAPGVRDDEEREPQTRRPPAPEMTLDVDALERVAAAASAASPALRLTSDLPPPPADFMKEGGATDRPALPEAPPIPPAPAPGAEHRYAPSRPASIFGQTRPTTASKSFFGGDLISDKSLDEVIMSYLASEPANEKK